MTSRGVICLETKGKLDPHSCNDSRPTYRAKGAKAHKEKKGAKSRKKQRFWLSPREPLEGLLVLGRKDAARERGRAAVLTFKRESSG